MQKRSSTTIIYFHLLHITSQFTVINLLKESKDEKGTDFYLKENLEKYNVSSRWPDISESVGSSPRKSSKAEEIREGDIKGSFPLHWTNKTSHMIPDWVFASTANGSFLDKKEKAQMEKLFDEVQR